MLNIHNLTFDIHKMLHTANVLTLNDITLTVVVQWAVCIWFHYYLFVN